MTFSACFGLAIFASFIPSLAHGETMYELVVNDSDSTGWCTGGHDEALRLYVSTAEECDQTCRRSINYSAGLRGFVLSNYQCRCLYDNGTAPGNDLADPNCPTGLELNYCYDESYTGAGVIESAYSSDFWACYRYKESVGFPVPSLPVPDNVEYVGIGICQAPSGGRHHDSTATFSVFFTMETCEQHCIEYPQGLRGFSYANQYQECFCWYDDDYAPGGPLAGQPCPDDRQCSHSSEGVGEIESTRGAARNCWRYTSFPAAPSVITEATGDPHFRTWKNEHFEFHGQCDLVMTKVENFANQGGLDLTIHLRTKIVRYWSYIKTVAIRIGNDILEVEGSAMKEDGEEKRHYRINYEYRGPLETLGGFPVTISPRNNKYTIDLDSAYPGQKIEIKTFKEFVGVKIIGASEESFGNAIGITGDFKTGKTLARDGTTVLHDFNDLGLEWQVLPSDGKLFHEVARPQFPELCYLPEDPRGERTRRLGESAITEEAAEAACAELKDEFDRKGCVYDILATQDMDMVGAY